MSVYLINQPTTISLHDTGIDIPIFIRDEISGTDIASEEFLKFSNPQNTFDQSFSLINWSSSVNAKTSNSVTSVSYTANQTVNY